MKIFNFEIKTTREIELEKEIRHLNIQIDALETRLENAVRPNISNYQQVKKPTEVAQSHVDEIKHVLLKSVKPVLQDHVYRAISGIDWYDPRQVGYATPDLSVAFGVESQLYKYQLHIPELNYQFYMQNF